MPYSCVGLVLWAIRREAAIMLLGKRFESFVVRRPVCVLARGILERLFDFGVNTLDSRSWARGRVSLNSIGLAPRRSPKLILAEGHRIFSRDAARRRDRFQRTDQFQ